MGTLLLANPVGHNVLTHNSLLTEARKVFGLRSRRLKLYLDEDLTQGMREINITYCSHTDKNSIKLILTMLGVKV